MVVESNTYIRQATEIYISIDPERQERVLCYLNGSTNDGSGGKDTRCGDNYRCGNEGEDLWRFMIQTSRIDQKWFEPSMRDPSALERLSCPCTTSPRHQDGTERENRGARGFCLRWNALPVLL